MSNLELWLTIGAAIAIALTIAAAIILVGHETEERPGHLDFTGVKPRRGADWPQASRARAESGASLCAPRGLVLLTERDARKKPPRPFLLEAMGAPAELVDAEMRLRELEHEVGETVLARRVATQEQPRGGDAA